MSTSSCRRCGETNVGLGTLTCLSFYFFQGRLSASLCAIHRACRPPVARTI